MNGGRKSALVKADAVSGHGRLAAKRPAHRRTVLFDHGLLVAVLLHAQYAPAEPLLLLSGQKCGTIMGPSGRRADRAAA